MKKLVLLIAIAIVSIGCKNESKKETQKEEATSTEVKEKKFPEELTEVFKKHGGIEEWNKMKTLSYTLNKEEHTIDLHSRKTVINSPEYSLGYNGKDVWVSDTTAYKKDPKFYYNLYFYFYAMPFVLADDGIVYSETKPIEFEGKKYPGVKISYKGAIGSSPDDNYFIYYDPTTKEMTWLGYTVTYFSKKPSDKFSLIRYNDWENVNGFLLPKSITWYQKNEEGNPTVPRGEPTEFKLPLLSQASLADSFFDKPNK
ncbi:hypothetical protein [Tenacibaculum aiptasiae]|uniref:hypothetical protein n=1 Tax=Tenacibaculum aiptasiae TaxID=426481 RepID=UPI003B5CC67F